MNHVLGNPDMVRHVVSQQPRALALLQTSKTIRKGEPCAHKFESWRRDGCPNEANGEDAACLNAAGRGLCEGTFTISGREVSAREAARNVVHRMLLEPTVVRIEFGDVALRIERSEENSLSVLRDGWRTKGASCSPSDSELSTLVHKIMTTVGKSVALPCARDSSGAGEVHVPRSIEVTSVRVGGGGVVTAVRG